jgi:hypothetical protein
MKTGIVAPGREMTVVYKAGDEITLSSEHEMLCLRDLGFLVDPDDPDKTQELSKEALERLESFPLLICNSLSA